MEMSSFVSAMMAAQAMSSCFTESPSTYKAANGTEITYCNYKGEKKYPGEKWTSNDCEKCSCTAKEGIKCCKAGQHHVSYTNVNGDSECVQKKEGCEIKWVLRNDENKACPESKIPKPPKEEKGTKDADISMPDMATATKFSINPLESDSSDDDDDMFDDHSEDFDDDFWDD